MESVRMHDLAQFLQSSPTHAEAKSVTEQHAEQLGLLVKELANVETRLRQSKARAAEANAVVRAFMAQAPEDAMLQAAWDVPGVAGAPEPLTDLVDTHVIGSAVASTSDAVSQLMTGIEVQHGPTAWRGSLLEAVQRGECPSVRHTECMCATDHGQKHVCRGHLMLCSSAGIAFEAHMLPRPCAARAQIDIVYDAIL
eukprot:1157837-Pelagomonas_calceolata.AAC.10